MVINFLHPCFKMCTYLLFALANLIQNRLTISQCFKFCTYLLLAFAYLIQKHFTILQCFKLYTINSRLGYLKQIISLQKHANQIITPKLFLHFISYFQNTNRFTPPPSFSSFQFSFSNTSPFPPFYNILYSTIFLIDLTRGCLYHPTTVHISRDSRLTRT